jgi:4-amino-4-deoxy-L-arabinose transferase-like glycosyltransferase
MTLAATPNPAAAVARGFSPARFRAVLLLVVVLGLAFRLQNFTAPWVGGHNAWGGAFYGNVARNFLQYGVRETRLAPVVSTGLVDPSRFEFYYHHPPLTMWLTAAGFAAFGVHEWVARLAPLVFSLLTIVLVAGFARRLFGPSAALLAALFMAVIPGDVYYGAHLDPNGSMSIFFTTLAVERYYRWSVERRRRDYWIAIAAIVLGCATGWFTYLIIPGILAHAWWSARRHAGGQPDTQWARLAPVLALPLAACVVFGLFFLHRNLAFAAGQREIFDDLGTRLLKRTVNFEMSRAATMVQYILHIGSLYTLPFMVLMLAWVGTFIADLRAGRTSDRDWWIPILLSYPLLYAFAFPGHLPGHNFFVRPYGPAVAMASALVVLRAGAAVAPGATRRAVVAAVVGVTLVVAGLRTRALHTMDDYELGAMYQRVGLAVAAVTTPRDAVFLPTKDDRIFQYYLDRPVTFAVDTPEKLAAAAARARGRHVVVVPANTGRFADFVSHLKNRYAVLHTGEIYIFEGSSHATD